MNRLVILGVSIGVLSATTSADTIHVPADSPTIQIAISKAAPFDTIIVSPGTYFEAINFQNKVITVQSTNPNDPSIVAATVIDANSQLIAVTFSGGEDANTILDGLTITGGHNGVRGNGTQARIRRCIIRDNSGTGIENADGLIEDSQVLRNGEPYGGFGLYACDGTIKRCTISGNTGTGVYDCDGSIVDSIIEHNGDAGIQSGELGVERCVIAWNVTNGISGSRNIDQTSVFGNGGFGIAGSSGHIRNCVIAGNRSGGLANIDNTETSHCTITGNRGFGIASSNGPFRHLILWDNLFGPMQGSTSPFFSNTDNPYFVVPGYWDFQGNTWVNGDYHLTSNSPAIDAGDPNYTNDPNAALQDIDGIPRIVGARVDIGAYEFRAECEGSDFDGDGIPDICDTDIDGDAIHNVADVCDDTPLDVPVGANGRPLADLNNDCKVDLFDFAAFQKSMY